MNKSGEEISLKKISEILKVPKEEIAAAIESSNTVNSIYSVEGANSDDRMIIEKIAEDKDEYNHLVNKITLNEIIDNLEEREKEVVLLRFYKEKTQSQVGKILGIELARAEEIVPNKTIMGQQENIVENINTKSKLSTL